MSESVMAERRAAEQIVCVAFARLTARRGEPLHYAMMEDTPVGVLGLAASGAGLRHVEFTRDEDRFVERLLARYGDRPIVRSDALDRVRRALARYFDRKQLGFDVRLDLAGLSDFDRRVLTVTARVPVGRVATYAEIAAKAGSPQGMRATGNALHRNPVAIIVPCHRVLRSDGSLGGYGGGLRAKAFLLRHEGALDK